MMEENINILKASITGVLGLLTSLWGWFGWLVVAWWGLMFVDWYTGTKAAKRNGKYSSDMAKVGIEHKVGCMVVALTAGIFDGVLWLMASNIPSVNFNFHILFCPLVVTWYVISEMGSILENAAALGAPVPTWFLKAIEKLNDAVDDAGGGDDNKVEKE